MTRPVTMSAPATLAAALAVLGLDVQLVVRRQDGQPLTDNDLSAVRVHVMGADLEAGREVSDEAVAGAAARALAGSPAFALTDKVAASRASRGELSNEEINRRVLARVRQMTADEVFQLSVACGVHRPDGGLTPEYGGSPLDQASPGPRAVERGRSPHEPPRTMIRRGSVALVLLPGRRSTSLRQDVEALLATYEADLRAYQERVAAVVARLGAGTPGLREAYVSPDASEVVFVGDEWTHELAGDVVGGLLDAIGEELEPRSVTLLGGGLQLGAAGLQGYRRVPLA